MATNAEPAQVMGLFKRTLKVGARFGVVIVMMGWRRARNYMWIPKSIGLASGGLLFGFVAGMLVKFYLSY